MVSPVPVAYVRMQDGDEIRIGARTWRVVIGSGHSPEHACLVDDAGKLMIAGDQVLPRITSNVSLSLSEPEADPLGEWLASIAKLKRLPDDLLVLPSHGEPFTGLHARLDALADGHRGRLDALHAHLAEPRRALDCFMRPVRPPDRRRLARPRHRRGDGASPASRGRGQGRARGPRRRPLVSRRLGLTPAPRGTNARGHGCRKRMSPQLSFEAALKRLEEIVHKLESGEASLDEAIELYGEGDRLKQQCEARLAAAQAQDREDPVRARRRPAGTAPFGDE